MTAETASIAAGLAAVRARVAAAAERVGRDPATIRIVGVSKTMPAERVLAAYAAGLRDFGENRVQEGEAKIAQLALPDATWHLIGHLQTNKARPAARLFDLIHSVDSRRVAEALARQAERQDRPIPVLLEVNYADEPTKFGFRRDELLEVAGSIAALPGLRVVGLMTVAPHVDDPEAVRPVFQGLRQLGDRARALAGDPPDWALSMGMTNDFAVAIEEGATIVRIGRAIFGERG